MSRYYLGIDGGQSSTTALIADEHGRILGSGRGGPCNHVAASQAREKFLGVVRDSVLQASQGAGLDSATVAFAAACLGFSGGPADKLLLSREAIRSEKFKVTHDAEIALTGALEGQPGIIVIAGTGSMAFGKNSTGRTARAGGWGYVFGDEGGAFDLVRRALRSALRQEEGWGPPTELHPALLKASGSATASQLMHRYYGGLSRQSFAALAALVTATAESGDSEALKAVVKAAAALARYVEGVRQNLFATPESVAVAPVGGVFQSELFQQRFASILRASLAFEIRSPRYYPAAGAVLEALRLDNNHSNLTSVPDSVK